MTMHSARIGKSLASGLLCLLLGVAASAQAALPPIWVTDLNPFPGDINSITSQGPGLDGVWTVSEDYNEATLVPYPSHDGWAIVNPAFGWFDKVVTIQPAVGPVLAFDFWVKNTGPYTWSDYHFEFWNASFQQTLAIQVDSLSSSVFANNSGTGGMLGVNFWGDPPAGQPPGMTERFSLQINVTGLPVDESGVGQFGIRQIATTVPEPETYAMLLAGLGLLGLAARRRKQNEAA
ncbi:MAG: PEP-CTERM sorting domain-containing protein [Rhodocyclaceae bacterium]|nr:PEP-CTERM sorting domain-containing protein [Rhodocyclaceae bacterium]